MHEVLMAVALITFLVLAAIGAGTLAERIAARRARSRKG
jgi:hypothetical protein